MTRLFERLSFKRFAAAAMPEPMAVPSSTRPILHSLEILQEPVVIERHRADDVRPSGKGDDADPVVRPALDEFARHLADRVDAGGLVAADREILRQHRTGNIEHEHDVDPARFDLGQALAQLRPRHRDREAAPGSGKAARAEIFRPGRRCSFPSARKRRGRRKDQAPPPVRACPRK